MKRTLVIEIDDAASPRLRSRSASRELKRLVRTVADELSWGDIQRSLQDREGNEVGGWTMTSTADAPVE